MRTWMLQIGFAQTDITPPIGAEMPGGYRKHFSKGIHDPLHASAVVIVNNEIPLAIVGVDALSLKRSTVHAARQQAEALTGIPPTHILIAASHTHIGGPTADALMSEADKVYCDSVADQIANAIAEANRRKIPAQIGIGVGHEDTVSFNRRFKMKDGKEITHPGKMNPDIVDVAGPIDPEVGVISAQTPDGCFLGCVVNFTCHCTVMGGDNYSADYPFYIARTIRSVMGQDAGFVFLNGACGDVTQVDNRNPRPSEFGEAWARRIGLIIGAEAIKVIARQEYTDNCALAAVSEIVRFPIRDLPATYEEMIKTKPDLGLGSNGADEIWARELTLLHEEKAIEPEVPGEIQALRIGDAAIVANPGEFFCQFGLDIKSGSPFKPTFVVELANGCIGYIPTVQAFAGGGYETRLARSSKLVSDAGERIVAKSLELLKKL